MVNIKSPLNLIAGIIFAIPPKYGNLIHQLLDILASSGAPSFKKFVEFFKIVVIVFGYYLIVMSFVRINIPEHKVRKYSKDSPD